MPVAVTGHPFGGGEVAIKCLAGAGRFAFGVDMQHDPRHFAPVSTFRIRVEQTQIGDDVFLIVNGQLRIRGCTVGDIGIKGWLVNRRGVSLGRLFTFGRIFRNSSGIAHLIRHS
jgi:hypothetical protein